MQQKQSHSTRVRGLKSIQSRGVLNFVPRRTLHECVDWNAFRLWLWFGWLRVALYTSAWIEISSLLLPWNSGMVALYTSAWIEILHDCSHQGGTMCRTLHECVDWNCSKLLKPEPKERVALYTSAWIEITMSGSKTKQAKSRTLHECVDWNSKTDMRIASFVCRTLHECVDWNFRAIWISHAERVALYTSAWIEIAPFLFLRMPIQVALYTSAWIEIQR